MDFLTKYDDVMDCKTKVVRLKNGNLTSKFRGQGGVDERKWISALRATKLMQKGVYGFLACIQEMTKEPGELRDVLVVREFEYVFPEESSGLSPHQDVEFLIEIMPGASPISIPPYKMAPAEIRELKIQL